MILAIDIGNTNVVLGLFDGTRLLGSRRLTTPSEIRFDDACQLVAELPESVGGEAAGVKAVVGSVVPTLTDIFCEACRVPFGRPAVNVTCRVDLPITIDVDYPGQVGADRIANAAAGFARVRGAVIVVDFGTATTFDVISSIGAYVGGVIIPGPQTAMIDLARRAAQLFEVPIEPPPHVIGRSTQTALKSGLFYGTVGQVDYLIERIIDETDEQNPAVIATGGLAGRIEQHSRYIQQVDPHLTLDGLRLIGEMN